MSYLKKEGTLLPRGENGELLPIEVELKSLDGQKIMVLPLTRGEIQRMYSDAKSGDTTRDQDEKIILEKCINPKYTEEEVKFLKPKIAIAIVTAILAVSLDMNPDEMSERQRDELLNSPEMELKKK